MRKILFWAAVVFVIGLFASLGTTGASTVHAQAATATSTNSVYFAHLHRSFPRDTKLIHFSARGVMSTQSLHTTRSNVGLVCPETGLQRLVWRVRSGGTLHVLETGQCLRTPFNKHINVSVRNG